MEICIYHKKIGAPQVCPKCGAFNPSGLNLPKECCNCELKRTSGFVGHLEVERTKSLECYITTKKLQKEKKL